MGESMKNYPPYLHPQSLFTVLARDRSYEGIFYMDLYSFAGNFVFIIEPEVTAQVQHSPEFHRHPYFDRYLGDLAGTKSIFSTREVEWQC
jgi:hypothetical protein